MPSLSILFYAAFLSFLLATAYTGSCSANTDELSDTDWLYIPIFLATDRELSPPAGIPDYTGQQMASGLNYAVKTMIIHPPRNSHITVTEAEQLGWGVRRADSSTISNIRLENSTLTRIELLDRAAAAQARSPDNSLLVFVHGCCTKHIKAMYGAAEAAAWYRAPVVAYDWTSPPWNWAATFISKADYLKNENNEVVSEPRFSLLMDELEKTAKPENISILAHSMGNRFVDFYLTVRHWKYGSNPNHPKLKNIDFANADVTVLRTSGDLSLIAEAAKRASIYINDSDPALKASRIIYRDFRTGAPHHQIKHLFGMDNISLVDHKNKSKASHDLPFWLTSDFSRNQTIRHDTDCRCTLEPTRSNLFTVIKKAP